MSMHRTISKTALRVMGFILCMSLQKEVWVIKDRRSVLSISSQYYKFGDKYQIMVLFPLLLISLNFPASLDLFYLIIKLEIH